MEEKLVLGLPDDGRSIVAPANAFRLGEGAQPGRAKYGLISALMVGAVGAELASRDDELAEALQPTLKPYDDETVGTNPSEQDLARIEDVANFLRQLSEEMAVQGNAVTGSHGVASVRLRYSGSEEYSSATQMERLFRAFNDNDGRILRGEDSFHFPNDFENRGLFPSSDSIAGNNPTIGPDDEWIGHPEDDDEPDTGSGGGSQGPGDGAGGDDDDEDRINRLPVSTGRAALPNTVMNVSALLLLGDLLRLVQDPDGNPLSIHNLRASDGAVEAYGQDRWLYTPSRATLGDITFTYQVSDGYGVITTQATMSILKPQPREVSGSNGDDRLLGSPFEDIIDGRDGEDLIYARESDDVISGGKGNDTLFAGDGDDLVYGGAGHDLIFGGAGADVLFGGDGNDSLYGEEGRDTLTGNRGDDRLYGGDGNDRLFGEDGGDYVLGEAGNDLLEGGAGDDDLSGGGGDDVVLGGFGDDVLQMGLVGQEERGDSQAATDGNDIYSGGEGIDTLDASAVKQSINIDLSAGKATGETIGTDKIEGIEGVVGTDCDDSIIGDDGANTVHAGAGNDTVVGGEGDDAIFTQEGDDVVVVASRSVGDDDTEDCHDGNDIFDGGEGVDTMDLSALVEAVVADLEGRYVEGAEIGRDTITNFEIIRGGRGNDRLNGDSGSDIQHGGDGNDRLKGRAGDDILVGGDGHDDVEGNDGNDTFLVFARTVSGPASDGMDDFNGGAGIDVYDASATCGGVTIDLDLGRAIGNEIGTDRLIDVESAVGGSGDDTIVDGVGVTVMTGGAGNDIFVFGQASLAGDHRDEIRDFAAGDRVDLSSFAHQLVFGGLSMDRQSSETGHVTFYHMKFEDQEQTVVRAILDLEHDDEIEILLYGRYNLTDRDFLLAALETTEPGSAHA